MRTKDRISRDGLFESCKTPGGVLLTKTVVQPSKDGSFLFKAVNLNFQNVTKHHIHLKPDTVPVKQPLLRIPFAYQEDVKNDLKNMLKDGIIEKSVSERASPPPPRPS
jgi:hypothetical protein